MGLGRKTQPRMFGRTCPARTVDVGRGFRTRCVQPNRSCHCGSDDPAPHVQQHGAFKPRRVSCTRAPQALPPPVLPNPGDLCHHPRGLPSRGHGADGPQISDTQAPVGQAVEVSTVSTVGQGLAEGCFTPVDVARIAAEGLAQLPVDGRRVLVLIPDGTRTMPMPLMFETLEREVGPRVAALDYLVALGTHLPMNDEQLSALVGQRVHGGRAGGRQIFNHRWDDPATFLQLGTIPAREISDLTGGRLTQDVPVALNRLVTEYHHVLVCGPVFPHEVVGFSGGTKYLLPGHRRTGDHPLHALARSTHHQLRGDRHHGHAGQGGDRPRGCAASDATFAVVAGRDARWCRGRVLRRRSRDVASGGVALGAAAHRVGRQAVRSRARRDAADVRRFVGGGEGHLQIGAGRGRRWGSGDLRAARQGGQSRARDG